MSVVLRGRSLSIDYTLYFGPAPRVRSCSAFRRCHSRSIRRTRYDSSVADMCLCCWWQKQAAARTVENTLIPRWISLQTTYSMTDRRTHSRDYSHLVRHRLSDVCPRSSLAGPRPPGTNGPPVRAIGSSPPGLTRSLPGNARRISNSHESRGSALQLACSLYV